MQKYNFNVYRSQWEPDDNGSHYLASEVDAAMKEKLVPLDISDAIALIERQEQAMKEKDCAIDRLLVTQHRLERWIDTLKAEEGTNKEWVEIATVEMNKNGKLREQIAALQFYKDATLNKESERERQIAALTAERDKLQEMMKNTSGDNY